jgi:LPPG:FO 2-phospho-L-lactate transferase
MIVALAGGVGGAKLADGLAKALPPEELAVIVNVGDDFEHLDLHISPDIDTVLYTLAGLANPVTGWGVKDETWSFMDTLGRLGGETWFRLGDRDLAIHVERTRLLGQDMSHSEITRRFAAAMGVAANILPASDDPVRTLVTTDEGELAFQHYFVRRQCAPRLLSLEYRNADAAKPAPLRGTPWTELPVTAAILCPSNPYLSIAPILAMPAARRWLEKRSFPVLAVSPIVAGRAIKGPAAKIMSELGEDVSVLAVARFYRGLIDALAIDRSDEKQAEAIAALGITPVVTDIVMHDAPDRERLARELLDLSLLSQARQ